MNFDNTLDVQALTGKKKLLVVTGWNHGFKKVEFTGMLRRELGYSLSAAKDITDEVVAGRRVELLVPEFEHERISYLSLKLGAKFDGQNQTGRRDGSSCL